jgi:hypothetical protein
MKLSAINQRLDFNIESILSKSVSELSAYYNSTYWYVKYQLVCYKMSVKSGFALSHIFISLFQTCLHHCDASTNIVSIAVVLIKQLSVSSTFRPQLL